MATPSFEDLADTFEFLDDWEDRYRHVIELGRAMPPLDDAFKVPPSRCRAAPLRSGCGPWSRATASTFKATATR